VTDIQLQLTERNQTISSLAGELSNRVTEAQTTGVGLEQDNALLRRELTALKAQLKTDGAVALEINRKLQEEVDIRRTRDAALIHSLKRFVTAMDLVPGGIANMILMATAPQILDDIVASASAKKALQSSVVDSGETQAKVEVEEVQKEVIVEQMNTDVEVDLKIRAAVLSAEAIWRAEKSAADSELRKQQVTIEALQESVKALIEESSVYKADVSGLRTELQRAVDEKAVLKEELDQISTASEVSSSDAKALLESQNKRLTEQLNAFELSLHKSQEEMQSKLDAAKAMTRELNSQLQARDQQYEEKEANRKLPAALNMMIPLTYAAFYLVHIVTSQITSAEVELSKLQKQVSGRPRKIESSLPVKAKRKPSKAKTKSLDASSVQIDSLIEVVRNHSIET